MCERGLGRPLNPPLTHHSDPVSDGLGRQVAAELGSDHAAVAVRSGHLPPDHAGLVGFTARRHCVPAHRRHALMLQDGPAGWSPLIRVSPVCRHFMVNIKKTDVN